MTELIGIEIGDNLFLGSLLVSFITLFLLLIIIPKYLSSFFGECVANDKSSKFHHSMLRGLGILYPIILILSSFFFGSFFTDFEIIIITLSTIVGFWDDKFGLMQKSKLIIFLLIGFIWSLSQVNILIIDFETVLKVLIFIFIFTFLVLFFNQIDGINGLATITFLISIIFVQLYGLNLMLFLPLFLSVLVYFFINLNGRIGIQGDAGSFFMGSFMAILFTKSIELSKIGIIFFILGALVFDVTATTLIRIYHRVDLTIGHRNNLYQKLVAKYQNHIKITFLFGFLQALLIYFIFIFLKQENLFLFYLILFCLGGLFLLLFLVLAYSIHTNKILK